MIHKQKKYIINVIKMLIWNTINALLCNKFKNTRSIKQEAVYVK